MKALVCRCEDVTLHELDAAIDAGHDDIESLKRYTGFGTGWCQGKACQSLCARRLLEKGGKVGEPFTARPPFHPVELGALAGIPDPELPSETESSRNSRPHLVLQGRGFREKSFTKTSPRRQEGVVRGGLVP